MDQTHQTSQQYTRRRDAGNLQVTERDVVSLTWIAEQFCISFDQLRRLLGRQPKAATKEMNVLSAPATRDIIGGIPIIAIQVIERLHHFESTLQDAIHELTTLAMRQQDNQNRYSHLWYFLHAETIPIFQRALLKLDQQIHERVRLYGLDAQEVTR